MVIPWMKVPEISLIMYGMDAAILKKVVLINLRVVIPLSGGTVGTSMVVQF